MLESDRRIKRTSALLIFLFLSATAFSANIVVPEMELITHGVTDRKALRVSQILADSNSYRFTVACTQRIACALESISQRKRHCDDVGIHIPRSGHTEHRNLQ